MKKLLTTLFLLLILAATGQEKEVSNTKTQSQPADEFEGNQVYALAGLETKPTFPGGLGEFYKYIAANYKMPSQQGLNGKVFVTFVIDRDGTISEAKILRDIGFGTGEEAVRVLLNSPKWIPGVQNGQPVRVQYSLPIMIKN